MLISSNWKFFSKHFSWLRVTMTFFDWQEKKNVIRFFFINKLINVYTAPWWNCVLGVTIKTKAPRKSLTQTDFSNWTRFKTIQYGPLGQFDFTRKILCISDTKQYSETISRLYPTTYLYLIICICIFWINETSLVSVCR